MITFHVRFGEPKITNENRSFPQRIFFKGANIHSENMNLCTRSHHEMMIRNEEFDFRQWVESQKSLQ